MKKKTLLVTWWLWYIWSHAVVAFEQLWYSTIIIDNLSNTDISVLKWIEQILWYAPDFHNCDLRDKECLSVIFEKYSFDGVLHFAWLKSPTESYSQALKYFDNNLVWSIKLFECMEQYSVKHIVFSSSANIYSKQDMWEFWIDENALVGDTTNPYGNSKFLLEKILGNLAEFSGFEVTSLRYFNPIWAHSSWNLWENPQGTPNNLLPFIMKVMAGEMPEVQVFWDTYETSDGTGVRDYIDIGDLIDGHIAWYESLRENTSLGWSFNVYNLWTWRGTSVLEVIDISSSIIWSKIPYKITQPRVWDLAQVYCNPKKAKDELSWEAKVGIEESIKNMWNFYKK